MPDISYDALQVHLDRWRKQYGRETASKKYGNTYFKIDIRERKGLIVVFLKEMKELGFGEEYFTNSKFFDLLREACFGGAPAANKEAERNGNNALRSELRFVLNTEGIFDEKPVENTPLAELAPVKEAPKTQETPKNVPLEPKFVGSDIQESARANEPSEVHLDEEFAELLGVKKDDLG